MTKSVKCLLNEYGNDIYRFAYSYVKDFETAKDITQITFIKFHKNKMKIRKASSLKGWLIATARNECLDYLRSAYQKKVQVTDKIPEYNSGKFFTEEQVIQKDQNTRIREIILSLGQKYREVLFLFYYEEMSIIEIANVLNTNQNTVKTRLARGREKFKEIYIEKMEGDKWTI